MNAAKQLAGRTRPGAETRQIPATPDRISGSPSPADVSPPWWACHWPLLTAIAWAALLVTIGTWWWLGDTGSTARTPALVQAAAQENIHTPAAPVSTPSREGLAWNLQH